MKNMCGIVLLFAIAHQLPGMEQNEPAATSDSSEYYKNTLLGLESRLLTTDAKAAARQSPRMELTLDEHMCMLAGNREDLRSAYYDRKFKKFGTLVKSEYNVNTYLMAERAPMPQVANHEYETLHDAAKADDVIGMCKLFAQGYHVNALNADGDRPLHCAIEYRSLKALALLAQKQADIRAYDAKQQFTPVLFLLYAQVNEMDSRPMDVWEPNFKN